VKNDPMNNSQVPTFCYVLKPIKDKVVGAVSF